MFENLRVFLNYLSLEMLSFYEYPINFFSAMIWSGLGLIPAYYVWEMIVQGGIIETYSFAGIFLYFAFTWSIIFGTGSFREQRETIISGDLVSVLVRNISIERYLFFSMLSKVIRQKLFPIVVLGIIGIIVFGPFSLIAFPIAFLGAIMLVLIYELVIIFGFWTGQNWGLFYIVGALFSFASGSWVPLDLLPNTFQLVLGILPFKFGLFIPAKVFIGDLSILSFSLIYEYVVWIIIIYFATKVLTYYGRRRYEQLGG